MKYQLIIERRAEKQIETLKSNLIKRVTNAISVLVDNPRPSGCCKLKVQSGYRLRVGNIRILYTVDDERKIVTIYLVSRRDQAYR